MSRVAVVVGFLALVQSVVAAPCLAGSSAAEVAAAAYEVRERYCAAVGADDVQAAAESLARVSETWAQVSEALEESKKLYLLYWRGMLAQCLGQAEKAGTDLREFSVYAEGKSQYLDLLRDAKRRLALLERGRGGGATNGGAVGVPFGVGAGLAGGAAVLAGLSGWQGSVMREREAPTQDEATRAGAWQSWPRPPRGALDARRARSRSAYQLPCFEALGS